MYQRDASQIKDKIMSVFKRRGPSLPVHIAKESELTILFASAFMSELISEGLVKISVMKIGSSPIYFLPGQEHMLENFSEHLRSKEKEAFDLLKERKFLKDSEQEPAIRVALRAIRDFAIPITRNGEGYWKYFKVDDSEFVEPKTLIAEKEIVVEIKPEPPALVITEIETINSEEEKKKPKVQKKSSANKKQDDKFFNRVKEFLEERDAEILEIISAGKSELVLRIKSKTKEKILVAYNKKKIGEKDIIYAHKKAQKYEIPFLIMSRGEISKKLSDFIEAVKILSDVEKI